MTAHNRIIKLLVEKTGGRDNHHNPSYQLLDPWGGSFVPDVVEGDEPEASVIHEVEVAKTKMTREFLTKLQKTLIWNVRGPGKSHRPFTTLWIVIENYRQMVKVFDRVEFLTAPPTELAREILNAIRKKEAEE